MQAVDTEMWKYLIGYPVLIVLIGVGALLAIAIVLALAATVLTIIATPFICLVDWLKSKE